MAFMKEKITKINLSGEEFPLFCGLGLLEELQDIYGDIGMYQNKLIGFIPNKDEFGNPVLNDEGLTTGKRVNPDVRVVNDTLIRMVREGMDFTEDEREITDRRILQKCDMPIGELAGILNAEFMKCFERKNQ